MSVSHDDVFFVWMELMFAVSNGGDPGVRDYRRWTGSCDDFQIIHTQGSAINPIIAIKSRPKPAGHRTILEGVDKVDNGWKAATSPRLSVQRQQPSRLDVSVLRFGSSG